MAICRSRCDQIITKRVFLESTQKGLLKNVQDGVSRPLGSREIQKTKVETVLVDQTNVNIVLQISPQPKLGSL